jgi:hypothetical protein
MNDIIRIGFATGRGDIAPGVVNQDINWSEFGDCCVNAALDLSGLGEVGKDLHRAHAMSNCNRARHIGKRLGAAIFGRPMLAHAVYAHVAPERC